METNRIEQLERRLEQVERSYAAACRRARRATALALATVAGAVLWTTSPEARAQFGVTLASLHQRLLIVEQKTAALEDDGIDLAIIGRNVHILDGSGDTESDSGLGNLTVGYNALRFGDNVRTGSHNLVLGDFNDYSSFGGLVAGEFNTISGEYATVSGGSGNRASGGNSSIIGGANNTASGDVASVSGGRFNTASGGGSAVSGGNNNRASGDDSTVSGGANRDASDTRNWRAGGLFQSN